MSRLPCHLGKHGLREIVDEKQHLQRATQLLGELRPIGIDRALRCDVELGARHLDAAKLGEEFGRNSLLLPICADNYAPSLQRIGDMINSLLGPKCVPGPISLDPATGKLDCKVTENDGSGDRTVPSCTDNGDLAPCWQLVQGNCLSGQALDVSPDPTVPASASATISYDCRLCTPGMPEPQRGCP